MWSQNNLKLLLQMHYLQSGVTDGCITKGQQKNRKYMRLTMIQSITHTVAHDTQYRETDAYQSSDPSVAGPNVGIGSPQGSHSSCSAQ